ncbi:MAG: OmpA family protein [Alphaproteobacteria bacterium]|nr:OmpA family protein [Alphaproteobacteria bacterium]
MINLKKLTRFAVIGAMIAPAAFAGGFPNVVHNTDANIVRNTFENCVVSTFTSVNDACTGQMGKPDIRNLSKEWRNVYFDFNKSTLNMKEKAKLDQLSKIIVESKEVKNVDLVGYADMVGNAAYNKRLSMKRAQTVKSYLATKGLKTRKVKVQGLGEAKSSADCGYTDGQKATQDQISCLAEDRRVEIMLDFVK